MPESWTIQSEAEIEEVLGAPSELVRRKILEEVDEFAAAFVARSPLVMVATADAEGRLDVSPKGDAPGFVLLEDARTIVLPERPGNRLAYGFRNILANPRVALIFVVPGTTETLRVAGTAELSRDPALLEKLAARGKPALLATRIRVEECFFHCGKAFLRSELWKPESWPTGYKVNLGRQLAGRLGGDEKVAEQIEEGLAASYRDTLY